MKRIILILIAIALIAPSVTFAHPGRTDKKVATLVRLIVLSGV